MATVYSLKTSSPTVRLVFILSRGWAPFSLFERGQSSNISVNNDALQLLQLLRLGHKKQSSFCLLLQDHSLLKPNHQTMRNSKKVTMKPLGHNYASLQLCPGFQLTTKPSCPACGPTYRQILQPSQPFSALKQSVVTFTKLCQNSRVINKTNNWSYFKLPIHKIAQCNNR